VFDYRTLREIIIRGLHISSVTQTGVVLTMLSRIASTVLGRVLWTAALQYRFDCLMVSIPSMPSYGMRAPRLKQKTGVGLARGMGPKAPVG